MENYEIGNPDTDDIFEQFQSLHLSLLVRDWKPLPYGSYLVAI